MADPREVGRLPTGTYALSVTDTVFQTGRSPVIRHLLPHPDVAPTSGDWDAKHQAPGIPPRLYRPTPWRDVPLATFRGAKLSPSNDACSTTEFVTGCDER